jgi:tetratricopeptide (TPR) repeat protein
MNARVARPLPSALASGRATRCALVFALGLAAVSAPSLGWADAAADAQDAARQVARDLDRVQGELRELASRLDRPIEAHPVATVEERLASAHIHVELGHFETAVALLTELRERPGFGADPRADEVEVLLGAALLGQRFVARAWAILDPVAKRAGSQRDAATCRLGDAALAGGEGGQLAVAESRLASLGAGASDEARYTHGKVLARMGRTAEAMATLGAIVPTSPFGARARYYAGVAATEAKDFEAAALAFTAAAELAAPRTEVRDLALLGLGRVLLELDRPADAAAAYESVRRDSPWFEEALFELAWAWVQAGDPESALHVLDVLFLVSGGSELAAEGAVLRGKLLEDADRLEEAIDAYEDVALRYGPIQESLRRVSKSGTTLGRYFDWRIRRHTELFPGRLPLDANASEFIESRSELARALALFDSLGDQAHHVRALQGEAHALRAAIDASTAPDLVPDLRDDWNAMVAIENSLIVWARFLLDAEADLCKDELPRTERAEVAMAASKRRELERDLLVALPRSANEFERIVAERRERLRELQQETFLSRQVWRRSVREVVAIEEWLDRAERLAAPGEWDAARAKELRDRARDEERALEKLDARLARAESELALAWDRPLSAGDPRRGELRRKREVTGAQLAEHSLYESLRASLPGAAQSAASAVAAVRERVFAAAEEVSALRLALDRRVQRRVDELRRDLAEQERQLAAYAERTDAIVASTRALGEGFGFAMVREAGQAIEDIMLDADVGLLDIAWKRKQDKTDAIRALTEARSARMDEVDQMLRAIDREDRELLGAEAGSGARDGGDL